MKPYVIFIDDDQVELDSFGKIVSEEFDYLPVKWPFTEPIAISRKPDLIVLDLYFPKKEARTSISLEVIERQKKQANRISKSFKDLYRDSEIEGRTLLRETFSAIQEGYELLWNQCKVLDQSAEVGRTLLSRIRANKEFNDVPIIFYSRKATVDEAERALKAGAFAVINKVSKQLTKLEREKILSRLISIINSFKGLINQKKNKHFIKNFNINVTLFKQEFGGQNLEFTVAKIGL